MFANPFGYIEPASTATQITPERPLAFSEGASNGSPFANQDYDHGVQAYWGPSSIKLTAALVNGTGLTNDTDDDRHEDQIYRVAYQSSDKQFGVGASMYNGRSVNGTLVAADPAGESAKKQLSGVDAQYISKSGPFVLGEYIEGQNPVVTYFTNNTGKLETDYDPGNHIRGYYAQGGWTFGMTGAHPLTAAASYDVFERARYDGDAAPTVTANLR